MSEIIVTAIVFASLLAAFKMIVDFRRDKLRIRSAASASESITTSELKQIVANAVDERFAQLEERLDNPSQPSLESPPDASDPEWRVRSGSK